MNNMAENVHIHEMASMQPTVSIVEKSCDTGMVVFYIVVLSAFVGGMLIMLTFGVLYSIDPDPKKNKIGNICYVIAMVMLVILFAVISYQASR